MRKVLHFFPSITQIQYEQRSLMNEWHQFIATKAYTKTVQYFFNK